ncbi:hypothetical protein EZI54_04415 [Marinobacter halodurans]|uniref:Uncharacterized protein n=1 Tax=Marinobacter halodurans TaxID=2528979 RepID=A0ABY1ZR16_9GAMM|nr:hypothetical protein [Marinobacter halodurans]TBW58106.1 hypothetical protein EZI54_04415 [Marinobacter halodurans]
MYFRDISISFLNYFGRHDPQKYKLREINAVLGKVEESFLSYLPKKTWIADLKKLNIIFGPKDPREKEYWASDGIGCHSLGDVFTPDEFLAMSEAEQYVWGINVIKSELLQLVESEVTQEAIKKAVREAIQSGYTIKKA